MAGRDGIRKGDRKREGEKSGRNQWRMEGGEKTRMEAQEKVRAVRGIKRKDLEVKEGRKHVR